MYHEKYAPWDHFPKTLRYYELMNPFIVLKDFFNAASVDAHRADLKQWRDCVITSKYYKSRNGAPGELIFIHSLNVKLIEALHLLLLEYEYRRFLKQKASPGQIEREKQEWSFFPRDLSENELIDPYQTLRKLFKKTKPQAYRDLLEDWLMYGLYNKPIDEDVAPKYIVRLHENLLKMYEIGWLIYQREAESPELKKEYQNVHDTIAQTMPAATTNDQFKSVQVLTSNKPVFENLNSSITSEQSVLLEKIISVVLHKIPTTEAVIYLGAKRLDVTAMYLVVITSNKEKKQGHELTSIIEETCKPFAKVMALVNNKGSVFNAIEHQNFFYNHVLLNCKTIYISAELQLPALQPIDPKVMIEKSERYWKHWFTQSKNYLKGAEYYMQTKAFGLAALSLHQSAENALIAIIRAVLGYKLNVHNLSRMLRITEMFTEELVKVFELNTLEGAQSYSLLQSSYNDARFSDDFMPDEESVKQILITVKRFIEVAETVHFLQTQKPIEIAIYKR